MNQADQASASGGPSATAQGMNASEPRAEGGVSAPLVRRSRTRSGNDPKGCARGLVASLDLPTLHALAERFRHDLLGRGCSAACALALLQERRAALADAQGAE